MSRIALHFLRLQLKQAGTWTAVLLLPALLCLILFAAPDDAAETPVVVGVAAAEETFLEGLQAHETAFLSFVEASEADILLNVSAGRWDCGLVLEEDFSVSLQSLKHDGLIRIYISEHSVVYPLVRETAAAVVAELAAPWMAADYLLSSGLCTEETLPQAASVLPEHQRVRLLAASQDGAALKPNTAAKHSLEQILPGILGICLAIWILFAASDTGKQLDTAFFRRLSAWIGSDCTALLHLCAAAVPMFCSCAFCLLLLLPSHGLGSLGMLALFALFLLLLAWICARCTPVRRALPVLLPFLPVFSVVLSPVILDLGQLFPALYPVSRSMPLTQFLLGCQGDSAAAGWLAVEAAGLLLGIILGKLLRKPWKLSTFCGIVEKKENVKEDSQ